MEGARKRRVGRGALGALGAVVALVFGCGSVSIENVSGSSSASTTSGGSGTTGATSSASTSTSSGATTTTTGSTGAGGASAGPAQLCVDTINEHRASVGLPLYERWADAEPCANGQAESDSQSGTAHGAFGQCKEFAQNECPGWSGPATKMIVDCLQAMWNEGPGDFSAHGHYLNMSSTKYTMVSCGFFTTPGGKIWAVQDFK